MTNITLHGGTVYSPLLDMDMPRLITVPEGGGVEYEWNEEEGCYLSWGTGERTYLYIEDEKITEESEYEITPW